MEYIFDSPLARDENPFKSSWLKERESRGFGEFLPSREVTLRTKPVTSSGRLRTQVVKALLTPAGSLGLSTAGVNDSYS